MMHRTEPSRLSNVVFFLRIFVSSLIGLPHAAKRRTPGDQISLRRVLLVVAVCALAVSVTQASQILEMDQFITSGRSLEISGDGQFVVGPTVGGTSNAPIYWTPSSGFVSVVDPEGRLGSFIGISRDGSTFSGTSANYNFLYSSSTGFVDLRSTTGVTNTIGMGGQGVSANGNVVVGTQGTGPQLAVVWEQDTGVWVDPTDAVSITTNGGLYAISDNGLIAVGSARISGSTQAARWDRSTLEDTGWTLTGLTTGSGTTGSADAMSADGSIVYGVTPDSHAFRWVLGSGLVDVNESFNNSTFWATTADGQGAGGSYNDGGQLIAALWDTIGGWNSLEAVMLLVGFAVIDIPDNLDTVSAMSSDGRYLVATTSGMNASTYWIDLGQSFVGLTVPEPSAALILAGLLPLAMRSQRR